MEIFAWEALVNIYFIIFITKYFCRYRKRGTTVIKYSNYPTMDIIAEQLSRTTEKEMRHRIFEKYPKAACANLQE